jgi:hypothetical protein
MFQLYDLGAVNYKDVSWTEKNRSKDEEMPMVEDYFVIAASFMAKLSSKLNDAALAEFMEKTGTLKQLNAMKDLIL